MSETIELGVGGDGVGTSIDAVPVSGSQKFVRSGGVYSAIQTEKTAREGADTAIQTDITDLETDVLAINTELAEKEAEITALQGNKVDKVEGKGLSTNDYTNEDKAKVDSKVTLDKLDDSLKHSYELSLDNSLITAIPSTSTMGATSTYKGYATRFTFTSDTNFDAIRLKVPAGTLPDVSVVILQGSTVLHTIPLSVSDWNANIGIEKTFQLGQNITLSAGVTYIVGYKSSVVVNYYPYSTANGLISNTEPGIYRLYSNNVWAIAFSGDVRLTCLNLVKTTAEGIKAVPPSKSITEAMLSTELLEIIQQDPAPTPVTTDEVSAFLPPEICVAVGTTIELYNRQVVNCGNIDNYHLKYVCSVGKTKKRKFTVTGATVGNYPLTLEVYNNNLEKVTEATTTIKVVAAGTLGTPFKLLAIGASYSGGKYWFREFDKLAESAFGGTAVQFIGSKSSIINDLDTGTPYTYNHEGRAGYTAQGYYTDSADGYAGNIRITVTGVTTPPAIKKQYRVPTTGSVSTPTGTPTGVLTFEVESHNIVGGNGTIDLTRAGGNGHIPISGTITAAETGTAGDASIPYTDRFITSRNPFWDSTAGKNDFNKYLTEYGVPMPDGVQLLIGTNSLSLGAETNSANLKTLVDSIRTDWPTMKIWVCFIPYLSNQDGHAETSGNSQIRISHDKSVFDFMVATYNKLKDYTNLYFTPIALTHDSEYNFGKVEENINPRNSNFKNYIPVESTHPQVEGYLQFADCMYSTWLAHK